MSLAAAHKDTLIELSTGHLPRKEIIAIERGLEPSVVMQRPEGALLCCSLQSPQPVLKSLLEMARREGASWVLLDRDVEPLDGLPFFDW